jgi:colanic acid biosynthesis glycosyl transferase WcaI
MRRLIFINRFFFPDHSATSQILSDLAFHLAVAGRQVHVVTSSQIYDAPQSSLPACQTVNGVHIHRVASTSFGRNALLGRSIDYVSFYRSAWQRLVELARSGDLFVAKTDPPLVSVVAAAAARRRRCGLINWLQDLYPELAVALGVPLIRGPVAGMLTGLRDQSLRAAAANVVVGRLMARKVEALGIDPAQIHVIANWCDDEQIRPLPPSENPLRQAWGLEDKFVVGYSGNLGRAHEFDTVIAAAERLREEARIVFLMIGGGKRFDQLRSTAGARGLARTFRFMPYQERQALPYSLGVADVHWLSLNPKLEGMIVPSKFYGIAAAGKPIIVIGDDAGELARLVQQHGCGAVIRPGDAEVLAAVLMQWSSDRAAISDMGARARKMLDAHFSRRQAFARWAELLEGLDADATQIAI